MSMTSYLQSIEYNNESLLGGTVNVTDGGYTTRNAPFAFARMLQELSQPGGILSEVTRSRTFAGEAEGIVNQGNELGDQTSRQLQQQGVNEAQATQQLAQVDQSVLQALSQAQAASEGELAENEANALTQFTSVLNQSEDIQKTRTEELRQYEELMAMIKKQQKFQNILGIAGLALNAFPGIGSAIGMGIKGLGASLFGGGGGSAPTGPGVSDDFLLGTSPGDRAAALAGGIGPAPATPLGPQPYNPGGLVPYRLPSFSSAFENVSFPSTSAPSYDVPTSTTVPWQGPQQLGPNTGFQVNIQDVLANAFN